MSTTGWLDEDEQRAWRAFVQMHSQLTARLHRQLQSDSGLSLADYEVLVHLTETEGERLRPFELQKAMQWEQSRLSHHLTRMQRRGLVRRDGCTEDGRGAFVALTADGRSAIERAAPGHVDAVRRMFFDGLDESQVALVERLSAQILDRLHGCADESDDGDETC